MIVHSIMLTSGLKALLDREMKFRRFNVHLSLEHNLEA